MTEYRTGNHWGVTIVREPDPRARLACTGTDHPEHEYCAQLVAVVVNGDRELAERICALLNGPQPLCKAVDLTPEQFEEIRAGILQALRKDGPSAVRIQPWGAETGSGVPEVTPDDHGGSGGRTQRRRIRACVEQWPDCEDGAYDPKCCRFPKSCSATAYDPEQVTDEYLEDL